MGFDKNWEGWIGNGELNNDFVLLLIKKPLKSKAMGRRDIGMCRSCSQLRRDLPFHLEGKRTFYTAMIQHHSPFLRSFPKCFEYF